MSELVWYLIGSVVTLTIIGMIIDHLKAEKVTYCIDCPHRNNLGVTRTGSFFVKDISKMLRCCRVQKQIQAIRKIKTN